MYDLVTIDTGHFGWKALYNKKKVLIEALVNSGALVEAANGAIEGTRSTASIDNILVETDLGPRYVGTLAKYGQLPPWAAYDRAKYGAEDFMTAMLYATLSELKAFGDTLFIMTALPAAWAQDQVIRKNIENLFLATHHIRRQNQRGEKVANVAHVDFMSETGALLCARLMTPEGEFSDLYHPEKRYAILDLGQHTLCCSMYRGFDLEKTKTYSTVSCGNLLELTAQDIEYETDRQLETWHINDILRGDNQIFIMGKKGPEPFDIRPIYEAHANNAKAQLVSIASQLIKNSADVDHVYIGGGGSEIFGEALTKIYPQAEILGQWGTVTGLRNYGVRVCQFLNKQR